MDISLNVTIHVTESDDAEHAAFVKDYISRAIVKACSTPLFGMPEAPEPNWQCVISDAQAVQGNGNNAELVKAAQYALAQLTHGSNKAMDAIEADGNSRNNWLVNNQIKYATRALEQVLANVKAQS